AIALIHTLKDTKTLWFPVAASSGDEAVFSAWSKNKKLLDKLCNVTKWTLHDLRRTYRTTLGRLGALHLFPDFGHSARIEPFRGELAFADQRLDLFLIDDTIDGSEELLLVFRVVAIKYGLHQQLAQRSALEQLA